MAETRLYFEDVNAAWKRAVDAGAKETMPLSDMFWGDRMGQVEDPSGHKWTLAQRIEEVGPDELKKRQAAFFAQMQQPQKH